MGRILLDCCVGLAHTALLSHIQTAIPPLSLQQPPLVSFIVAGWLNLISDQ